MSRWKAVYRNKLRRQRDERFACTGCGAIWDGNHSDGPPNGICACGEEHGKIVNDAYRENFEKIDWTTFESKAVTKTVMGGKTTYRFKEIAK